MQVFIKKFIFSLSIVFILSFILVHKSYAMVANATPISLDPGLYSTVSTSLETVHAWGQRQTQGAWGTGPVNYESGATLSYRANSSGTLNVDLIGTYCPGGVCSYGSGTGYKGFVQFWNDPKNYIAFGLIHDPGVSPTGTTLMIEGAANGVPVGGYWPDNAITGYAHHFEFTWTATGISVTIDNIKTLGVYPVAENNPSISFLAAGRETGDICDTTFENINFSDGSVNLPPISIPSGSPYATYTDTITENGTGSGNSAYINMHDGSNDALSVGIQSDTGDVESNGTPQFVWERVQNGTFTYQYVEPASNNPTTIELAWWQGSNIAIFYANGTPIAQISMDFTPTLYFNVEGNVKANGDSINDTFGPVNIQVANGLTGSWNTTNSGFNTYGLQATNTNGQPQNGATFTITGTASGIPQGEDWNSTQVSGIAMIAQG